MTKSSTPEQEGEYSEDYGDLGRSPLPQGHRALPSAYWLARAYDELNVGIVLTDRNARVLHFNRCARNIVASKTGLIAAIGATLKTTGDNDTARLREFIRKAALSASIEQSRHFAMVLGEGAETDFQFIIIAGLGSNGLDGIACGAGAVVFVTERYSDVRIPENVLRGLFGLTSSEASLATHLVQSKGLAAAAGRSSMGINTARTHLKRIFAKTETSRQAELVALLLKTAGFVRFD